MTDAGWLIVGLGNPGPRYEKTWHNVGRMAVERFAEQHAIPIRRHRFRGLTGTGRVDGERVRLLLPNTYMNRSGESVARAANFERTPLDRIIIVYDDFDLPLGRLRIREQGSAGSHNGMKSVIQHLQSQDFPRVRIGIGAPPSDDTIAFVLSKISRRQEAVLEEALDDASDALTRIVTGHLQSAQERYNHRGR
ncbi:MAG: aminoacyl-tRNA hydrolase [Saccharofermentanales bacterium]|jgi:PTH1 family peptidyl-tRNA hydrolase